ncbi:MAG: 50S ribosomal protein L7ae-like protein [Dysosmobacter sp.]
MLEELSSKDKVVGLKQVQRAVSAGRAGRVFLACDADPRLSPAAGGPLPGTGRSRVRGAPWPSWAGPAGIDVGTAAAALLAKEKPLPTE